MTQEPGTSAAFGLADFQRRVRVGPWVVEARWPGGARGGPHELHITPAGDGDPQAVARGISTSTLNAVPLVELTDEYAEQIRPMVEAAVTRMNALQAEADKKRNRSPLFYARIAAEYVGLIEAGERQPVQELARRAEKTTEAVRGWVRTARNMGFLTGEAGRTTGELTDKARELLQEGE